MPLWGLGDRSEVMISRRGVADIVSVPGDLAPRSAGKGLLQMKVQRAIAHVVIFESLGGDAEELLSASRGKHLIVLRDIRAGELLPLWCVGGCDPHRELWGEGVVQTATDPVVLALELQLAEALRIEGRRRVGIVGVEACLVVVGRAVEGERSRDLPLLIVQIGRGIVARLTSLQAIAERSTPPEVIVLRTLEDNIEDPGIALCFVLGRRRGDHLHLSDILLGVGA